MAITNRLVGDNMNSAFALCSLDMDFTGRGEISCTGDGGVDVV